MTLYLILFLKKLYWLSIFIFHFYSSFIVFLFFFFIYLQHSKNDIDFNIFIISLLLSFISLCKKNIGYQNIFWLFLFQNYIFNAKNINILLYNISQQWWFRKIYILIYDSKHSGKILIKVSPMQWRNKKKKIGRNFQIFYWKMMLSKIYLLNFFFLLLKNFDIW